MIQISVSHQQRFDAIKRDLMQLGYRESILTKAELLFFEAINISRTYGDDPEQNDLLSALKSIQFAEYDQTRAFTRTARQKELTIKKFIVKFKTALAAKA